VFDRVLVVSTPPARERILPLLPALAALFPQAGLQRGTTVGCAGAAPVSLALSVVAESSQRGAWVGVAGLAGIGLRAAAELGVSLERLVSVIEPTSRFTDQQWADVLAAMIDGFDLVLIGPAAQRLRSGAARRLQARAQSRGAVLVVAGAQQVFGCDLELVADGTAWQGLGLGHGVADARLAHVELCGRRMPLARRASIWLPGPDGRVVAAAAEMGHAAPVVPLRRTG
jgi:hypothetical protein